MVVSRFVTAAIFAFCVTGFADALRCKTAASARQQSWWQPTDLTAFERYVSDRWTDGVDGYCDSWAESSPVCLSMSARGHIYVRGSKRDGLPYDADGHAYELDYYSCDYGLVVRQRNRWTGWICRHLEGEFSPSSSRAWPWQQPRGSSCYHWNHIRNAYFGTPDIVTISGATLAGYNIVLVNASLTIHCCRYGDRCNEFLARDVGCETRVEFPFDQN